MLRRRFIFQSRLSRVCDAKKSPEVSRSNDRELGLKKTKKSGRVTDFDTGEDNKGDRELGNQTTRRTGRVTDLDTGKDNKMRKMTGEDEGFDTVENNTGDREFGKKKKKTKKRGVITDLDTGKDNKMRKMAGEDEVLVTVENNTGDRESGKKKTRKSGRITDLDTAEDNKGDRELGKKKRGKRGRVTDLETGKDNKTRKMAGEDEDSDRISALPDSIIHHIFSFIRCSKDIVRTTLLSKNWKRVLDSYQSFDFDERRFLISGQCRNSSFEEYVEKSLATRLAHLECVNKLRLYAETVADMQCIAGWIRIAMAKNLKELDVRVITWEEYAWPLDLTDSNSITFLKITGPSLYGLAAMKMCNLRMLSFKEAEFLNVNLIKKLEENSPLLEDLRLVRCPHLSSLEISSLVKLKRVEVQECRGVKRIEITAPNLETFWFHADMKQKCVIDLKSKENLRNVTLKDNKMTESAFEECISMCPSLEKLELYRCNKIAVLRICSLTLKSLSLVQCAKLHKIDVDAPNLYSFQYIGSVMQFPLVKAPRLSEVKFSFKHRYERSNAMRHSFFSNFDGCRGFRLIIYTAQNMKIFVDPREANLSQTRDCKIEVTASSSKVVKSVDNWLRESHGKNLDVISSNEELLKLINTLIIDREDSPSCCRVHSLNKCWRHYIKDVKVSDTEGKRSYSLTWRSRRTTEEN